jgi:hypothetical protein
MVAAPPPEKIPVDIPAPLVPRAAPSAPPAAQVAAAPLVAKAVPAPGPPAPVPELTAEVVSRRAPPPLVKFIGEAQKFRPQSFLELLDASIGLLKK